ncbi:uncharacterized protein N7529_000369 [Penicillium soppii]|uniref:uncharacterized protein n=1 Tax=Penicillium soppii TaxID=69789 RepID=UPI0025493E0D|nr:uncharacterized protein N7529_000369 [Penicillium soppii]KAJ5881697.1 hypothetical protein N7529_000369 [Penicillium soppii]
MGEKVGVVPVPAGETLNFDYSNPWEYKENIIIVSVGLTLSTLFLAMRIYTRVCLLSKFGWDDVSMILAWVGKINMTMRSQRLTILIGILFGDASHGYRFGGTGIHMWNVTPEMFDVFQKVILAAAVIYVPALAFAKVALIILYHRIVNRQSIYVWSLHIIAAVICGYSIAIVFALIFACNPIERGWNSSIKTGYCVNRSGLYIATAVTNIITDIALMVLPVPLVLGLQMPRIQKFGLLVMFIVGCATLITSILRLATLIDYLKTTDLTYQLAPSQLWIYVEANLIIICPCLPFLRQFLRRYSPAWIGESGRRYFHEYNSSTGLSRSRRKQGLSRLQDDIALAENVESTHSQSHIVKEVQWQVTEERMDAVSSRSNGLIHRI